jgi:hypothetical protein
VISGSKLDSRWRETLAAGKLPKASPPRAVPIEYVEHDLLHRSDADDGLRRRPRIRR